MGDIERAVLSVRNKINLHRELYEKNEEAVKQHLIAELMTALGWEWNNPEEVRPEERTEDGRADYALVLNGEVFAYVEAKNLGVNILKRDEPLRQLARYCFNTGVRYGILANGAVWIAIKAFEEGSSLRDRVLLSVDVLNEPLGKAALKMSLLSKSRIISLERLTSMLKALELSFSGLKMEGFREDALIEYLTSQRGPSTVPVEQLTGKETPKAAYVYENGWRLLPLAEQSIKGVLLAVLLYLGKRSPDSKRREIMLAYEQVRKAPIGPSTALEVLKKLCEEEKLRVSVEV